MSETVIKHHIWPLKVMFSNRKMPEAPDFEENRTSILFTCRLKITVLCIVTEYQCDSFQAVGSCIHCYQKQMTARESTVYRPNLNSIASQLQKLGGKMVSYLLHWVYYFIVNSSPKGGTGPLARGLWRDPWLSCNHDHLSNNNSSNPMSFQFMLKHVTINPV